MPLFPQLRPLLERLCHGKAHNEPVFRIADAKKSLAGACRRLSYPLFSQRSLRRMFIVRAIERGVDVKVNHSGYLQPRQPRPFATHGSADDD